MKVLSTFLLACVLSAQSATNIVLEAESGVLVPSMVSVDDVTAIGGRAVVAQSTTGTATYTFIIAATEPTTVYNIWCRVVAPNDSTDSFYVSMDGGPEDVYDTGRTSTATDTFSANWQVTAVSARNGGDGTVVTTPRSFTLAPGTHTLVFRARETGSKVDQITISSTNSVPPVQTNSYPNYVTNTTLSVAWDYPTNSLTNIANFILYLALGETGAYNAIHTTTNQTARTTNTVLGVNRLMVTARSKAGLESDPSNELKFNVVTSTNTPVRPRPPRNVRIP